MDTMGRFTAIGMRTKITAPNALIINTCSGNDTAEAGDATHWTWANPTNRAVTHKYHDIEAVSTEALWQGTKMRPGQTRPDAQTLAGDWRRAKGRKPAGAYAGPGQPLITTPGEARRRIYIPAMAQQLRYWSTNPTVTAAVEAAYAHDGPVFLRDHDTGRGIDRNGPMSHAWLIATWLNECDNAIEWLTAIALGETEHEDAHTTERIR